MKPLTRFLATAVLASGFVVAPAIGQSALKPVLKPNQIKPIAPIGDVDLRLKNQLHVQPPAYLSACLAGSAQVQTGWRGNAATYGTPTCPYWVTELTIPPTSHRQEVVFYVRGFEGQSVSECNSAVVEGTSYNMDATDLYIPSYSRIHGEIESTGSNRGACELYLRFTASSGRTRFLVKAWTIRNGATVLLPLDWVYPPN